jgi:hypothetical protein
MYEFLANGVLGLAVMLVIYSFLLSTFLKSKNYLFKTVILNTFLISLIEDLFYLQLGVFFIVTFISLLLYNDEPIQN